MCGGAGHCVFDYRGTHQLRDPHPRFWPALNNNQSQITPPQVPRTRMQTGALSVLCELRCSNSSMCVLCWLQAPYGVIEVAQIMLPRQFTAQQTNQARQCTQHTPTWSQ